MSERKKSFQMRAEWWAAALVVAIIAAIALSIAAFNNAFTATVPVTLVSDRSGLVLEPEAKVRLRGLQVGRVASVSGTGKTASIELDIDSALAEHIPANIEARIDATSVFGAKFVDLSYPSNPSPQRLSAGTVLTSQNVAVEVNTVFQNLVDLIQQVDPSKLNAILSAFADGVGGQGERIGEAITSTNDVLIALNSRNDAIRADFEAAGRASDTYAAAAQSILAALDAASTTSATVAEQAQQLDGLLVSVAGFGRSGAALLGASKDNLIRAVDLLEPTTGLLKKYDPSLTCLFLGALKTVEQERAIVGGNGRTLILDAQLMLGDDPYRFPEDLPIVNAKGGPGGAPGCGSLPDVAENWPVRYLVTDTGFGAGMDMRPNPGIGFPGWANYFPVTRAVPEQPSIRYEGPVAPGPIPYPGAPPYGAPLYNPDGTPRYPGVPPPP